jgi:hypothetical protein
MPNHKFKGSPSWNRGQETESNFGDLLKQQFKEVRPATLPEQYDHIDWICEKGTIDVKAMKRISRGSEIQSEFIWVEFRNNAGLDGWLYGKQDWIAFESPDRYVLVRRSELLSFCLALCDLENRVDQAKDALYRGYTRDGRRDLIAMIRFDDLFKIETYALMKQL